MKTQLEKMERQEVPGYVEDEKGEKKKKPVEEEWISQPGAYTTLVQRKLVRRRLADENRRLTESEVG
ncbi:unnamed protein product [Gongylonema pulchrum]|uniref:Uncharacterized protein n=1 Tax=Gongylonema pulchrum TaxID=637853 RepID=A0A3P6SE20_9BILA|nr:unnamed protein product [Gongylonema pulchrum]